jgi:hypothetical protein
LTPTKDCINALTAIKEIVALIARDFIIAITTINRIPYIRGL